MYQRLFVYTDVSFCEHKLAKHIFFLAHAVRVVRCFELVTYTSYTCVQGKEHSYGIVYTAFIRIEAAP